MDVGQHNFRHKVKGLIFLVLLAFSWGAWSFPIFNTNLDPHVMQHRHAWAVQGGFLLPDASWRALSREVNGEKVTTQAYYWQGRWEYFVNNDWAIRLGGEWQEIYNRDLHYVGIFVGGDIVDVLYSKLQHRFYGVFTLGFSPHIEFEFYHNSIAPQRYFLDYGTAYQGKFAIEYEYLWKPAWQWRGTVGYFYEKPLGINDTPKVSVKELTIQGPYAGINLVYRPQ